MIWLESKLLRVLACAGVLVLTVGFGAVLGARHEKNVLGVKIATLQKNAAEVAAASAAAAAKAEIATRATEHAEAVTQTAIADAYQRGQTHAQADAERVIADLRAGNLRLRREWRGNPDLCASLVPCATPTATELDAAQQRRAESAAAIVRTADQCDAQVTGLQSLVKSYVKMTGGTP